MFGRNKVAQLVAEFLGAGVLTLVVLSVKLSTIGIPFFVSMAGGLAVAVLYVVFARASGAHLNPAITIGLWTTRQVKTTRAIAFIVVQLLGAWAAYYLFTYFVNSSLQQPASQHTARIFVAEAVGAFIFSMGWAAAIFRGFLNSKTAVTIGVAFMIGGIVASSAAAGVLNPAVAVGMRYFDVFGSAGWLTYALGPVAGSIVGFNLYALLFAPSGSLLLGRASSGAAVATSAPAARARATSTPVAAKASAKRKPAARKPAAKRTPRARR